MITIPKHARTLEPYQAGKPISELAREKELSRIVKLASNENPFGPSPKAAAAVRQAIGELHRYVDPRSNELVAAIAERFGRNPSQIICAHGTDALLGYIINAFTSEQDELLTSEGTFIGIYVNTNKLARKLSLVSLKEYTFDLEALSDSISADTKIIYLANPNNPTGTMFTADRFEAFMNRVPEKVLVILDEAYNAYVAQHDGYWDGLCYHYKNLIVTRSLSKVYGLAGLRIGFAAGPEHLIDALYKIKLPFEPNRLAQVAAMAALDDEEFLQRTIETNHRSLARLMSCFEDLHIPYIKTVTNFVLMLLPTEHHTKRFFERCLDLGLIVRPTKPFGIARGIRISSGSDDETTFAINVIKQVWTDIMKLKNPSLCD
ncbi:MAG: histidinol-phosphate transaminase [Candidatus Zixiibacteriota bacterium]